MCSLLLSSCCQLNKAENGEYDLLPGVIVHVVSLASDFSESLIRRIPAKARFGRPYCPINLIVTLSPSLIDF